MTAGERFIRLRRLDFEKLITDSLADIARTEHLLRVYPSSYTPEQMARMLRTNGKILLDIEYYQEELRQLGGAENGESISTESQKDSESPNPGFTGITCTTV
jgi:hypothetical protein